MADIENNNPRARVIVVDETSENERLSSLIRDRLLEEERIAKAERDKESQEDGTETDSEAEAVKKPAGPSQEAQNQDYEVVNVNERILDGLDVTGVMEKMGCCTCPRCQADVRALTLSLLTPQYCIGVKGKENSFVGYYASRHSTRILAQLQVACERVKDHPRHDRES